MLAAIRAAHKKNEVMLLEKMNILRKEITYYGKRKM